MLIHDVARPNTSNKLIENIIYNLKFHDAVIPANKVSDSIKLKNQKGLVYNVERKNTFQKLRLGNCACKHLV